MKFEMEYPPSVNPGQSGYYRLVKRGEHPKLVITERGRRFREHFKTDVWNLRYAREAFQKPLSGALFMRLEVFPPDRRRRDLDNILKALLDAQAHARVYDDDSQIEELWMRRHEPRKPGRVLVEVTEEPISPEQDISALFDLIAWVYDKLGRAAKTSDDPFSIRNFRSIANALSFVDNPRLKPIYQRWQQRRIEIA